MRFLPEKIRTIEAQLDLSGVYLVISGGLINGGAFISGTLLYGISIYYKARLNTRFALHIY